ncbi:MAG: purine-nucleoside phosphorylase [Candidatus Cloacimonadota bacterium]|nr:MAG: purine-nucleoside phosphorylase [Candidatus Cloacimonadota bacterium]
MTILNAIKEAVAYIQSKSPSKIDLGIICGTGLGPIADEITNPVSIPYSNIPHFQSGNVKGHKNRLVIGKLGNKTVAAFQGRFHFYEGYSIEKVTFPVRVLAALGVQSLIVTNAAGGLNHNFSVGDIMLIEDHINFMFQNPLVGKNHEELGPRFPDMSQPYSKNQISKVEKICLDQGIKIQKGTYIAVTGPSYETRAELRFFAQIGDAVGMSTVPEVIAAKHNGIKNVLGLSVITNMATGHDTHEECHNAVVEAANLATPKVVKLVKQYIKEI